MFQWTIYDYLPLSVAPRLWAVSTVSFIGQAAEKCWKVEGVWIISLLTVPVYPELWRQRIRKWSNAQNDSTGQEKEDLCVDSEMGC